MKAMVMAAGLGTRLRPLTYEIPKPMVPVANRPVIELILRSLATGGVTGVVCNLHWFPEAIEARLGDGSDLGVSLTYSHEEELLGTAGGVRNVRDFFGDEPFLVMAGDALTDIDFAALAAAHGQNDGLATLAVKKVTDTQEYGVIVTGSDGRIQGFQEKPDPAEALSDLANCMIYALSPEIFDHFPDMDAPDFALDVFPALLNGDVPFYVHETEGYWNDVGSPTEYLQGNLDVAAGRVDVEWGGELVESNADPGEPGEHPLGAEQAGLPADTEVDGRVLIGKDVEVGAGVRFDGPCVIGERAKIGDGARIKSSVLLPDAEVPAGCYLVGAIAGRSGSLTTEAT
jgi:mannose-1-phosphate guanylyltransferase/mannose-1-phosphate guanylyltransferase/phosphomannomutase